MDILEKSLEMLEKYPLCNNCLGRQFALLGHGLQNETRGEAIKLILTMKAHQTALANEKAGVALLKILAANGAFPIATQILQTAKRKMSKPKQCCLCSGKLELVLELANDATKMLKDYEYSTFLVGVELPTEVEEREDELRAEFDLNFSESMRNEFSRIIGKAISELNYKAAEFKRPDVAILINPFTKHISLQVNPLHIAGRYRKLARGVSQSRWMCHTCHGRGCKKCNWTGKMYLESVEDFISEPALKITNGQAAVFHGAGREDIDARMLGNGRPFVIEIKAPKNRSINLETLEKAINKHAEGKVKVHDLRFADKEIVRQLKKAENSQKSYQVIVEFNRSISDEELEKLETSLKGILINQQTPRRVLHRRADRLREKYIYKAKVKRLTPNRARLNVTCQGGLYVKELVTGDEGRTRPSVAEILDTVAIPLELDVLKVITREHK
ncbi:MAG TPA: tRNA pseudouridine(54/55) synthase Pus10 [Candidatus Bathyarchaeia archaeon]|nr:tRNA pseudouridine(54/55) synthase Pus10 [Candidatus Bathyarchaeia archaeon]